jgi:hypothetical protein
MRKVEKSPVVFPQGKTGPPIPVQIGMRVKCFLPMSSSNVASRTGNVSAIRGTVVVLNHVEEARLKNRTIDRIQIEGDYEIDTSDHSAYISMQIEDGGSPN